MSFLQVRHNIEIAHRLYELEGKCENIHGHSCWVEMKLYGHVNSKGILEGLAFGDLKKKFRGFLDSTFDHHLLLNEKDPWAGKLVHPYQSAWGEAHETPSYGYSMKDLGHLPGLMPMPGDPTTENIAKWIANWATDQYHLPVDIYVQETHVNGAGWSARPKNGN